MIVGLSLARCFCDSKNIGLNFEIHLTRAWDNYIVYKLKRLGLGKVWATFIIRTYQYAYVQ